MPKSTDVITTSAESQALSNSINSAGLATLYVALTIASLNKYYSLNPYQHGTEDRDDISKTGRR
jgi:hypothetical protein